MTEALRCMAVWILAALLCVLIGASCLIDWPSDDQVYADSQLSLNDSIRDARRVAKEAP